jgi:DNA-binding PadR family transcriptional regulator
MDAHIKKVYVPMTETGFYILLCLREPNHGYGIVQMVKEMTEGDIVLAPGTMYGSLSKMEKDGLIKFVNEEEKRKIYTITELGTEVLQLELKRIKRLYHSSQEVI